MPLTPAHAAAVIPLRWWKPWFWLSPLVVGSMAPDYLYYAFPSQEQRHFGHSPLGLAVFCIPVGLALLYAFHYFFKRPLVLLMPRLLRARLWPHCGPYPLLPLRRLIWSAALIYLGAITHVLWDSMTHDYSWGGPANPQNNETLTILGHNVSIYGTLQYGSSLAGVVLVAWWSWRWYRIAPACRLPADWPLLHKFRWTIIAGTIFVGAATGVFCGLRYALHLDGPFNIHEFFSATFIVGVDAMLLVATVYSGIVNFHLRRLASQRQTLERHRGESSTGSPYWPPVAETIE